MDASDVHKRLVRRFYAEIWNRPDVSVIPQIVARMMFSGQHRAPFLGVSATHRRVAWAGAAFFTVTDGLVSDLWVLGDLHSLHEQLGSPD